MDVLNIGSVSQKKILLLYHCLYVIKKVDGSVFSLPKP